MSATTQGVELPVKPPSWSLGGVLFSLVRNAMLWPFRLMTGKFRALDIEVVRQAHLATRSTLLPACGAALVSGFAYTLLAETHTEIGLAARDTAMGFFGNFLLTHVIPVSMAHLVVNRGALSLGMDMAMVPPTVVWHAEATRAEHSLDTVFFPRAMAMILIAPALSVFGILGMAVGAWGAAQLMTDAREAFPEFCIKLLKNSGLTDVLLVPAKTGVIALVTCVVAAHCGLPADLRHESAGAVATRVVTRSVLCIIVTNAAVSVIVDVLRRWI